MVRWCVMMESQAEEELRRMLQHQILSSADIKVLLRWISDMEEFGPKFISNSSEWHDHALEREWFGHRSSAFSHSGRIIYKVMEDLIVVKVAKITTDHDYKKIKRFT